MSARSVGFQPGMTGRELASALEEQLNSSVRDASADLEARVTEWCSRAALDLTSGEGMNQRGLEALESAVMQLSGRTAHEQLTQLAGEVLKISKPNTNVTIMLWADRMVDATRGARTARNLLNHRRKIVGGVINTLRRNSNDEELQDLAMRPMQAFADISGWALRLFDFYVMQTRLKRDLQNNYRSEWLTYLEEQIPGISEHLSRQVATRSRRTFIERYEQAISEFSRVQPEIWSDVARQSSEPRAERSSEFTYERRLESALMSMQTPSTLTASEDLSASSSTAQVKTTATADGFMLTFNANSYGVVDIENAVLMLIVHLAKTHKPGEVQVEGDASQREIRLILHTQDAGSLTKALSTAKFVFERL